jgi:hypothetical protein
MDAFAAEGIFLFEGFCFDRRAGGLFRVDNNCVAVLVPLGARAPDVLGVLLYRADFRLFHCGFQNPVMRLSLPLRCAVKHKM